MALVIRGQIVTMSKADPSAVFTGRIYLSDDGVVEAVTAGNGSPTPGFTNAPLVDAGDALVIPGIIDLHNHLGYNALPLWAEPTQKKPFLHHNDWTDAPSYKAKITWPAGPRSKIHSACERACCTISTSTFRVSAGLLTSLKNAMRAPRIPSCVLKRT